MRENTIIRVTVDENTDAKRDHKNDQENHLR